MSWITLPVVKADTTPPKIMVSQWRALYKRGAASAPPVALLASSCLGYTAYQHSLYSAPEAWKFLTAAAVTTMSIVPYTLSCMRATNGRLMELAADAEKEGEWVKRDEATELLGKWNILNAIRGLFPLTAVVLAWVGSSV